MTDSLIALVPTYGIWLVGLVVFLSCLAVPMPASVSMMVAGGFASAGEIEFNHLIFVAFIALSLGDQSMYWLSRNFGAPLLERAQDRPSILKTLTRARTFLGRYGIFAILLSRTIFSPLGPYVSLLVGSSRYSHLLFSTCSILGAMIWSCTYASIGFVFASQIVQLAQTISSSIALSILCIAVIAMVYIAIKKRKIAQESHELKPAP